MTTTAATNTHDAECIIRRELEDLEAGVNVAQALATIAQAVDHLRQELDPAGMIAPRITHANAELVARYR